jgi:hypothetical protein
MLRPAEVLLSFLPFVLVLAYGAGVWSPTSTTHLINWRSTSTASNSQVLPKPEGFPWYNRQIHIEPRIVLVRYTHDKIGRKYNQYLNWMVIQDASCV